MSVTEEIEDIRRQIAGLPRGSISRIKRGEKILYYHKWYENAVARGHYVSAEDVESYKEGIGLRRRLQKRLRELEGRVGAGESPVRKTDETSEVLSSVVGIGVKVGEELLTWARQVVGWERREVFDDVMKFLRRGEPESRVLVLYGIRRTGKTTLLQQAVLALTPEELRTAAYVKVRKDATLESMDDLLMSLHGRGYRLVFVDEVTLMDEFIDGASLFSDVYAPMGMKIVLSGTDSLGFWMAANRELFDRSYLFHTTFVPFREYARLLKADDIGQYVRFGGLLKRGESDFGDRRAQEKDASFKDVESTRFYIDTAIAENIQHSLRCCQDGRYFLHLKELHAAGELTNAINRVIEDMNHEFVVEVVTREFRSHDLGSAKQLLRTDRRPDRRRRLDRMADLENVTARLMELLSVRNVTDLCVPVTDDHMLEIKSYLRQLDLIADVEERIVIDGVPATPQFRTLFLQPGMRYAQAEALVYSLASDLTFAAFAKDEREYVVGRVLEDVEGRMLEDIVLAETLAVNPKPRDPFHGTAVFRLRFESGEFDMVVNDQGAGTCDLFEIKRADQPSDGQYRHLEDAGKLAAVERLYGRVASRTVLYRGEDVDLPNGIRYRNVGEYLKSLAAR